VRLPEKPYSFSLLYPFQIPRNTWLSNRWAFVALSAVSYQLPANKFVITSEARDMLLLASRCCITFCYEIGLLTLSYNPVRQLTTGY